MRKTIEISEEEKFRIEFALRDSLVQARGLAEKYDGKEIGIGWKNEAARLEKLLNRFRTLNRGDSIICR